MTDIRHFAFLLMGLCLQTAEAADIRGYFEVEAFMFSESAAQDQKNHDLSASSEINVQFVGGEHDTFDASAFVRADAVDARRTHTDLREAFWLHAADGYELSVGIRQIFWGVTEGVHLVDIINQTDIVEGIDAEEHFGQSMINFSFESSAQTLSFFLMPGSRERSFPGYDGRLRLPLIVDTSMSSWESSKEKNRIDVAARWAINMANFHVGVSGFSGTSRDPELAVVLDLARLSYIAGVPVAFQDGYTPVLAPHYPVINQIGLDVQWTQGDLLWKMEAIQRNGGLRNYQAIDAGIEYTNIGVFGSQVDIGWLGEFLYDSRRINSPQPFENDILLGWRFSFNNFASSEVLTTIIIDTKNQEKIIGIEARNRISDKLAVELEAKIINSSRGPQSAYDFVTNTDFEHKLRPISSDDYMRVGLTRFF